MLHLLATIANVALCASLLWRKGWRTWKWIFYPQMVSVVLIVIQNHQLFFHIPVFHRWWQSFDIANVLLEILFLFDLAGCCPWTFSVFAALGVETIVEYAIAESGQKVTANEMWHVRVAVDIFATLLLTCVILRAGGNTNESRTASTRRSEETLS